MSPTTKNQLQDTNNDYVYDSAGNLTQPGPIGGPYVYDAENHLTSADGVTYTYDGDGNRVMKSNGTIYWYGANSASLMESDLSGNVQRWYYFFNGQRVGRQLITNEVGFYMTDYLGSVRYLGGSATGYNIEYYPFGGVILNSDTGDDRYQFTGKERDPESGLDNFGARYDSSSLGRFMTPDPLLNSGRPSDPQTWNRYAYALNNPLNIIDPTGLYDLVNNCAADDKKCNKQFNQHAQDLKNGLSNLQKKVDSMKDGPEKDRLQAALTAFGTEGDHNGVNAAFGTLGGSAAAETKFQSNDIGQLSATVTFDPSKISSSNEYAIDAAHEGTHIEDTLTEAVNDYIAHGSLPGLSDFSREYRGYQTSIFAGGWDTLRYRRGF